MKKIMQMKKSINRITSIVAVIFSAISLIEGLRVLFGISVPNYIVFTPLLIYNIIMGGIGIFVGIQIFQQHINSLRNSSVVMLFHTSILITISLLYSFGSVVSAHSVDAMLVRAGLWLAITITLWITNKYLNK